MNENGYLSLLNEEHIIRNEDLKTQLNELTESANKVVDPKKYKAGSLKKSVLDELQEEFAHRMRQGKFPITSEGTTPRAPLITPRRNNVDDTPLTSPRYHLFSPRHQPARTFSPVLQHQQIQLHQQESRQTSRAASPTSPIFKTSLPPPGTSNSLTPSPSPPNLADAGDAQTQNEPIKEMAQDKEKSDSAMRQQEQLFRQQIWELERAVKNDSIKLEYLKNVVVKFIDVNDKDRKRMIPILATVLNFSPLEIEMVTKKLSKGGRNFWDFLNIFSFSNYIGITSTTSDAESTS